MNFVLRHSSVLFWGTVLNKESNRMEERCCSLIRALRSHFSLKLLQFHDTQIREQKTLGSSRFTTKGPPQQKTSGAPF